MKNKIFSFINIFGLAFGIAVCILIFQYVALENSYDKFHLNKENIYRITLKDYHNNELEDHSALIPRAIGHVLLAELPEISGFARLHEEDEVAVTYNEIRFLEDKVYYADSSFFTMFSFPLLRGDPKTVLAHANTATISESMAEKYFGQENPVGKTILVDDGEGGIVYTITGIFEDIPENSHVSFDFLFSIHGIVGEDNIDEGWGWSAYFTYVVLAPNTDPGEFESKIPSVIEEYYGELLEQQNVRHEYFLQPVTDIYLYSDGLIMEPEARGNPRILNYLTAIALFILILAWFNYINLTTAKATERAKEVGIRKINGAFRMQLTWQFLLESFFINLIGMAFAITIVQISHVYFEQLVGKSINYSYLFNSNLGWILLFIYFAGSFLSGLYPAFILTLYKPISVLKGSITGSQGVGLRKGLIIMQFLISFTLISGSMIVYRQIYFMINHDLGFNPENIILIHKAEVERVENFDETEQLFFEEIIKHPQIKNVTLSFEPGRDYWYSLPLRRQDQPPGSVKNLRGCRVDFQYIDTYQIQIVAGRNFSREYLSDSTGVILNEKAVEVLGFNNVQEAVGQTIMIGDFPIHIIGVIKNFHQLKLRYDIQPVCYHLGTPPGYYAVRFENNKNLEEGLSFIKTKFDEILPGNPFTYTFLDTYFKRQYTMEQTFESLFEVFTIIAIFIACLGLFGLSSFELIQRTKEIGIRKVLGAKVINILALFTKNFMKLIAISVIISIPVSYFIMSKWLQNFAFNIKIGLAFFIIPVLLLFMIALLTVSYQIIKTANANPANSLRYE